MTMPYPPMQNPNLFSHEQQPNPYMQQQQPDPELLQAMQQAEPPDYDQTIKAILEFMTMKIIGDTQLGTPQAAQALVHAAQAVSMLAKSTDEEGIHTEQSQKTEIMGQLQNLQQQQEQHHLDMVSKVQDMMNKQQSHEQKAQQQLDSHQLNQATTASKAQEDLTHQQTMNNQAEQGETPATQATPNSTNSAD